jgi:hypothetical protein
VISEVLSSPFTSLRAFDISGSHVDEKSATILAEGLSSNKTLEELNLGTLEATPLAGILVLLSSLQNPKAALRR